MPIVFLAMKPADYFMRKKAITIKEKNMLVPTMTDREIYIQMADDAVEMIKLMTTKIRNQALVMKRTNNFRWVETLHITTTRSNRWSVVVNINSEVKEINYYLTTEGEHGVTAYSFIVIQNMPWFFKFTPHFFKRYRERMHIDETKSLQLLKQFFKTNMRFTPSHSDPDENKVQQVTISMPQGMGFGCWKGQDGITEIKTFLPNDMLNKGQRELADFLAEEEENFLQGIEFMCDIKPKKEVKA